MELCQGSTIVDVPLFLSSHFKAIEANPKKRIVLPCYDRLVVFYEKLKNNLI